MRDQNNGREAWSSATPQPNEKELVQVRWASAVRRLTEINRDYTFERQRLHDGGQK